MIVPRDHIDSPLFMLMQSNVFLKMGLKFADELFENEQTNAYDLLPQIPYVAVNISFALELALKGIFKFIGRSEYGHDLLKLYNGLPEEVKNEIVTYMESKNEYVRYSIMIFEDANQDSTVEYLDYFHLPMEERIQKTLSLNKLTFVNFRYFYENNPKTKYLDFPLLCNLTLYVSKVLVRLIKGDFKLVDSDSLS